ncbi:VVA0879 family protein [Micromonospora sp. NPDC003816]|uniref:VVA0879 family protein n=1 Tax=Micromonospora sp. NPDC003816 TaxID=3364224 RepID=UPI0036C8F7C4
MKHRKLTQQELFDEARERFGADVKAFAFQCPNCDDIATIQDFIDAGDGSRAGQECIGRLLGALKRTANRGRDGIVRGERGCDWAAYGLFRGPWEIVMPAEGEKPERSAWSFPLAPAPAVTAVGGAR